MASLTYTPEPHERGYYEGLFQAADVQRTGNIGGAQAVQFFQRSKLPMEVLKNIWTVADQPSTSSLNRQKFALAIRLIQLTQNGQKGQGRTLAAPPGVTLRPAFFEGVSNVSVPLPQAAGAAPTPPTPQQQRPPVAPQRPPQQPPQQQQHHQPPPTPNVQRGSFTQGSVQGSMQHVASAPPTPQSQRQSIQMQQQGMPTPGQQSRALVAQDPYAMAPQERSRYEELFPQYAKPDGFMYGKEAVELFTKSGVDQNVLRGIWNLVDAPVDNRLDKLEFAMAMHLIVCISKKGLAPPKILPMSLKALKTPQSAPPTPLPPRPAVQQQPPAQQVPPAPAPAPQQMAMPSPAVQRGSVQGAPQYGQPPPAPQQAYGMAGDNSSLQVPPVVATSGMSISDAFEGLSTTSGDVYSSTLPPYVPDQPAQRPDYGATPAVPEEPTLPEPVPAAAAPPPAPVSMPEPAAAAPTPVPQYVAPPAPSTTQLASSYDMGDSHEELSKLKDVLQKLQAENISLKAQLGNMTDEEKGIQKELGATVAEIGKLSSELEVSRADVLAAKSRLLEASAELKAAQEKRGVISDLISEANETKSAIQEAHTSIANANDAAQHLEQQKDMAMQKSDIFESNLFGYDGAPGPAPTMQQTLPPGGMNRNEPALSFDGPDVLSVQPSLSSQPPAAQESMSPQPVPTPAPIPAGAASVQSVDFSVPSLPAPAHAAAAPVVSTVSSEDEAGDGAPEALSNAPEMFSNDGNYGAPPPQQQQPYPPQQQQSYPPQQQQQQQPHPRQTARGVRPVGAGHHNRQSSLGFNADFVMGGAALPITQEEPAISPAARTYSDSSAYGYDDDEEFQNVEEMKKKAKSAQETARDAAAAHRKLVSQADELRQDADKAEATARSLRAAAAEKKKGAFGGGGKKKKLVREAEKAAQDAEEIRKRFLAVQGQSNDAQAVAMETKREADKLREAAEKAELDMAAAASMREQARKERDASIEQEAAAAPEPAPSSNGYGGQSNGMQYGGYGQQPPQGYGGYSPAMAQNGAPGMSPYGMQQQPGAPPPAAGGYQQYNQTMGGAPAMMKPPAPMGGDNGGFAPGVMGGGGGFDLPSPTQISQAPAGDYSNPFGS